MRVSAPTSIETKMRPNDKRHRSKIDITLIWRSRLQAAEFAAKGVSDRMWIDSLLTWRSPLLAADLATNVLSDTIGDIDFEHYRGQRLHNVLRAK